MTPTFWGVMGLLVFWATTWMALEKSTLRAVAMELARIEKMRKEAARLAEEMAGPPKGRTFRTIKLDDEYGREHFRPRSPFPSEDELEKIINGSRNG